jgi:hypothetical protein
MFGADLRTPFHHHRQGQPPAREDWRRYQARLPHLSGVEVGTKKLFEIHAGDLLFNIVFAWEGAVAVARPEDHGRFGSHRFLTCVPRQNVTTAEFLCFFFLTDEGLEKLGKASPGGAGRNRTLGLKALESIQVPVPPIEQQLWFDGLQAKVGRLKVLQAQTRTELDARRAPALDPRSGLQGRAVSRARADARPVHHPHLRPRCRSSGRRDHSSAAVTRE